jgi:hypothetical protein
MKNKMLIILLITGLSWAEAVAQSSGRIRSRKINEVTVVTKQTDRKGQEKIEKTLTRYNRRGKPLEELKLRADGSVRQKTVYTYTYDGKQQKRQTFNSKDELKREKLTAYHPVFRKKTEVSYLKNGKVYKSLTYEYDLNGRRTRELRKNAEGVVTRERRYTYDQRGMLLKREEIHRNGKVEEIAYQYKY